MDIDKFVQYLNDTNQSAIKGVKHFNLNFSDHKIRKLIKSNGYKYINQKWIKENSLHTSSHNFTLNEQEEGVNMNVLEEQQENIIEDTLHTHSHDFTKDETTSHEISSQVFTLDEIELIRAMMNDWKRVKQPIENDLISKIEAMPKDEKIRKTIVISKVVGEQLDEFCKINRVQKSTVLELAIKNLLEEF